jgi:lipoprotein-releasing system permease protein
MDIKDIAGKIQSVAPMQALTPFLSSQGILVQKGELTGVMLHGLDLDSAFDVLHLENKILSGTLDLHKKEKPQAAIGKELAKKFNLKIGDMFNVIVPRMDSINSQSFNPKRLQIQVASILDFGKFDYNDKVILTEVSVVQELTNVGEHYFGLYVNLMDANLAPKLTDKVADALGMDFRVRSWWDLNQNFFTAAELEKVVIFIVILFVVIVASLNVSSALFISVLRRYFDIAILKTLGATEKFLIRLFVMQGFVIALASTVLGIGFGVILSLIIKYTRLLDVPGRIYNFDHLPVEIRFLDLFWISLVTILICVLSSWFPARKGARQKPSEGLKYESA